MHHRPPGPERRVKPKYVRFSSTAMIQRNVLKTWFEQKGCPTVTHGRVEIPIIIQTCPNSECLNLKKIFFVLLSILGDVIPSESRINHVNSQFMWGPKKELRNKKKQSETNPDILCRYAWS